jgi:N-acetylmuramoyl-L-alanine amidase
MYVHSAGHTEGVGGMKDVLQRLLFVCLLAGFLVSVASAAPLPRVKSVRYDEGSLRIELSGKATFKTVHWKTANRFCVDIDAEGIGMAADELDVNIGPLTRVRWAQWKPENVRIVLDLTESIRPVLLTAPPADTIVLRVVKTAARPPQTPPKVAKPVPVVPEQKPVDKPATTVTDPIAPVVESAQSALIRDLRVERDDEGRPVRVVVVTDIPTPLIPSWTMNTLSLELPNTEDGGRERILVVGDETLIRARTSRYQGETRVSLDFTRRVAYTVAPLEESNGYAIEWSMEIPPETSIVPEPAPIRPNKPLRELTIVIDPGHGAHEIGAKGRYGFEKEANLDIARRLRSALENKGVRVIMTRETDVYVPLQRRPQIAMEARADAFISIHCNATKSPQSQGVEVFHRSDNPASYWLAWFLYQAHRETTGLPGRGVKADSRAPQGGLAVLKRNTVPCALLEVGFLSHPDESRLIADPRWRQKVAEGLVSGLEKWAGGSE